MASSLSMQLSTIASKAVATSTLDRKKKQKSHAVSLVYDPKVAATQDLDSIYLVALEALRDLESLDHRFAVFEKSLFSETSISIDRYIQTADQNAALDKAIESFLSLLAPRILLQPAVLALEWLVRRFKINELNAELLLLSFLPYYSHPVFSRILDTVAFPLPPLFSFLANSKTAATSPPRTLLARAMSRDAELFSLVSEHVLAQINGHREYHTLLSFWTSTTISVILSLKEARVSEEVIAEKILPHISAVIAARKSPEAQTAAYMIIVVLVSQCRLSAEVLDALAASVALNWTKKSSKTGLAALTQTVQFRDVQESNYTPLSPEVWKSLQKIEGIFDDLDVIRQKVSIDKFLVSYALSMLVYDQANVDALFKFLDNASLSTTQRSIISQKLFQYASASEMTTDGQATFCEALTKAMESPAVRSLILDSLQQLAIDVDELELKLNTKIREEVVIEADDSAMEIDSTPSKITFEQQISSVKRPQHSSLLAPTATKEFEALAEIYLQGLAEKKAMLSVFVKNANIFSAESNQALSFLLRVWISPYPVLARVAALDLFATVVQTLPVDIDLQAAVVFLLVALSDHSEKVRKAAADCLTLLSTRYEHAPKSPRIWGLESFYGTGPETDQLRWLGVKDVRALLTDHIAKRTQEAVLDYNFIKTFIGGLVDSTVSLSGEKKKKEATFKASVLAFLCSHVTGSPFFRIRLPILSMVVTASHTSVSLYSLCSPLFSTWIRKRDVYVGHLNAERLPVTAWEQAMLATVVSSDVDGSKFVNECLKADITGLSDVAGKRVVAIFDGWQLETQLSVVRTLLDLALDDQATFGSSEVLDRLNLSTETFQALLQDAKLGSTEPSESPQRSKRRKQGTSQQSYTRDTLEATHKTLKRLTLTLDLLERNSPETHLSLLKPLFLVLGDLLLLKTDSYLPVQYTQQVLVDCLLPIIHHMNKDQLDASAVRIDLIVSCIRSSTSPQVQNKLLLLVSALAKLSPELVLHSVMPIFTFMGANTVRQDDEFSAHVIQHTISQVIPALAHFTAKDDDESFGTVELLLSFVNAFVHVPYHRRVKLFSTLAKTLGPNESLYLLLRLLGKRHWDAVSKGKTGEAQGLTEFVDVFLRGFTVVERMEAVRRYVSLLSDIPASLADANGAGVFTDDIQGLNPDKMLAFKINLLQFIRVPLANALLRAQVSDVFKTSNEHVTQSDVNDLQSAFTGTIEKLLLIIDRAWLDDAEKYRLEAFDTLDAVLNLLPIQDFVVVLEKLILREDDALTVRRGLVLIRSKFDDVKVTEALAKNSALKILPTICAAIARARESDNELVKFGLQAIDSIASTFGAVEPDAFAGEVLAVVIGDRGLNSDQDEVVVSALVCLSTFAVALGARLLGSLPRIVQMTMRILGESVASGKDLLAIAVITFYDSLIKRIPTFMSSYLPQMLGLVFSSASGESASRFSDVVAVDDARTVLLDNIIAKIQTRPVLAAVIANWDDVVRTGDYAVIKLHLSTMAQVIDKALRKSIVSDAGRLFDFVLAAFDTRNNGREMKFIDSVESDVIEISMKIILKLNDKVFRPAFVRTAKWATEDAVDSKAHRSNRHFVFYKFCEKLFGSLKSIVTSYYGYIVDTTADLLTGFVTGQSKFDRQLWDSIVGGLTAAFSNDQEEFWQAPVRFDKIVGPLLSQIGLGVRSDGLLQQAIVAFAVSCSSEDHYKTINKEILRWMKTLDEDEAMLDDDDEEEEDDERKLDPLRIAKSARKNAGTTASDVKILAIHTLQALYERLGEEWLSMLPQLVPVVAELLEDDDETVETEVRKSLVPVIEGVLGESLDRYLN